MEEPRRSNGAARAIGLVVLLGLVSLFGDITYEGARSVLGPYFQILGASAAVVGVVAGLGEFLGHALRLASGCLADRTRRYWTFTLFGYAVNLLAVPALALAGRWEAAAVLVLVERVGKALRTPARDAILSHATSRIGRGWGFGLHEAMDQIGAVAGPLVLTGTLAFGFDYRSGFACLAVPAVLALITVTAAAIIYPRPQELETKTPRLEVKGFDRTFWLYLAGVSCVAAGFVDFPLIAFHFERTQSVVSSGIPALYAMAMGVDAVAALVFGRLFDRLGLPVLIAAAALSSLTAPLVFLGEVPGAILGMLVWGLGMGAQESVMRAAVADMVPPNRRATAYGVFNAGYGLAWFLGSAAVGIAYTISLSAAVAFSVVAQLASLPLFLATSQRR